MLKQISVALLVLAAVIASGWYGGALAAASGPEKRALPPSDVPGVIDPSVTQENIAKTVCVPNYTTRVRPPTSFTDKLKLLDMKKYDLSGEASGYELDHRIDLAAGGAPRDPGNLWMQPWPEARLKDRLESYTHRQLCTGKMTLKQVQSIFREDFWKSYDKLASAEGWPE